MKKVLKFAGIIAAVLALVGFILIMVTPVATYQGDNVSGYYEGMNAIFGTGKVSGTIAGTTVTSNFDGKLAWSGLLAWIFVLVALLVLVVGIVLPLLKVKTPLDKFAGIFNLVAVCLLVVAGVFVFVTKAAFWGANEYSSSDYVLGAGWIIGGILLVLSGLVAIAPAAIDFIGKKK